MEQDKLIVGEYFDGDNNNTLKWVQHDIYSELVYWIYKYSADHFTQNIKFTFVGPDFVPILRKTKTFDHRVLQTQHDIIATNYRYLLSVHEDVSVQVGFDLKRYYKTAWKLYFHEEAELLSNNEEIATAIATAVAYQNTDRGYKAEKELISLLLSRYSELPKEKWRFK